MRTSCKSLCCLKPLLQAMAVLVLGWPFTMAAQEYHWAKGFGGTNMDEPISIDVDQAGNSLIAGDFLGTADFDPGPGYAPLVSSGTDIFLAKYEPNGAFGWAFRIGGNSMDLTGHLYIDNADDIFIAGQFSGTVDFDPGGGTANLSSGSSTDAFFAKYDNDGNYLLARGIIGLTGSSYGCDVADMITDPSGNIYLAGSFMGVYDFDPGPSAVWMNSLWSTRYDIFFARFDINGNFQWAKKLPAPEAWGGKAVKSITLDGDNNLYLTGLFASTDFDPDTGTVSLSAKGIDDIFVAKYNSSGGYIWAKKMGGWNTDVGVGIEIVGSGIFLTGHFENTSANFDPNGTAYLVSSGYSDIFLARYDTAGNYHWAKAFGGSSGGDQCAGLAMDTAGNMYITGNFTLTADFDPGPGTAELTSVGVNNIFFARYDNNGNYGWARNIDPWYDTGNMSSPMAVTPGGDIFLTGWFENTVDCDPGPSAANLSSNGSFDIFIAKYGSPLVEVSEPIVPLQELVIYPNPADDKVVVEWDRNVQDAVLTILNVHGQMVVQKAVLEGRSVIINRGKLPSGVYFVRLAERDAARWQGRLMLAD